MNLLSVRNGNFVQISMHQYAILTLEMLTPRSIQVLKSILLMEQVFTFKQISQDLNISEKTVRNQLDEIQLFLANYNLFIKTTPGTGSYIVGNMNDRSDAYTEIVNLYREFPEYHSRERIYIILYLLLINNRPCYIHNLEDVLHISRSSLYKDLRLAEEWLKKFKIGMSVNRKKGISLISGEKRSRRALVKLYSELNQNPNILYPKEMQSNIDAMLNLHNEYVMEAHALIKKWEKVSGLVFESHEFDRLRLNLLVTFDRIKNGFLVTLSPDVIQRLRNTLWVKYIVNSLDKIRHSFQIEISPIEVYYLSGLLMSSKSKPIDIGIDEKIKGTAQLISKEFNQIVSEYINLPNDIKFEDNLSEYIFEVLQKAQFIWESVNPLKDQIKIQFPNSFKLAYKIKDLYKQHANMEINEDEVANIAIFIMSALQKSRRPLRTLFIFDRNPSEVDYAISLIKNHIAEIDITEIIQSKEINNQMLLNTDLILSCYPLPKSISKPNFTVPLIPDFHYLKQLTSQIAELYELINDNRVIKGNI